MTGRALVAQADAIRLPLRDESVDLAIFSPPYFALRSYGAGPGEIGSEATPAEFLAALWQVMGEVKRVLKPSGSAFVNLGDKYATAPPGNKDASKWLTNDSPGRQKSLDVRMDAQRGPRRALQVRDKSLLGLPWAFALGCTGMLAALGGPDPGLDLILRAEIVLDKRNGLPESVRDRVRRSHEQLYHFVKSPRYYSAIDEIRLPASDYARPNGAARATPSGQRPRAMADTVNPLGAPPGSVWSLASEPLRLPEWLGVNHYAAFSSEIPRRCILAFSPPGICLECGEGRWPVVDRQEYEPNTRPIRGDGVHHRAKEPGMANSHGAGTAMILGYACRCTPFTDHPERRGKDFHAGTDRAVQGMNDGNGGERFRRYQEELANPRGPVREYHLAGWQAPPTRPAVVLDCFSGAGTTIGVARQLGRIGIGLDLSFPYCRAAKWRVFESGQFGKAVSRTWTERQGSLL